MNTALTKIINHLDEQIKMEKADLAMPRYYDFSPYMRGKLQAHINTREMALRLNEKKEPINE